MVKKMVMSLVTYLVMSVSRSKRPLFFILFHRLERNPEKIHRITVYKQVSIFL